MIDNRCTMPSRVRAFLYQEQTERLVDEMTESLCQLKASGCNRLILACNTSHIFLPKIYEKHPELEKSVVHIVNTCVDKVVKDGVKTIYLLGSEGTIDSGLYQDVLRQKGIKCLCPDPDEYSLLRDCIEAVKTHRYTDRDRRIFLDLITRNDATILGCTELPILYAMYGNEASHMKIYDPVYLALQRIKKDFDNEQSVDLWSV